MNLGITGIKERLFKPYGVGSKAAVEGKGFMTTIPFRDWWKAHLETAANVILCPAGRLTRIGEFIIGAQRQVVLGYGDADHPDNQGYLHLAIFDNTATTALAVAGSIRLSQVNANETRRVVVFEGRTEVLAAHIADKSQMIALPRQDIPIELMSEDSMITIEIRTDATITIARFPAARVNVWNVPVTIYN